MVVLYRFRLDGKRLFFSGGSRGFGRELALAIVDATADVALTGRDAASLERTAIDMSSIWWQAWPILSDMSEPSTCEAAYERALAELAVRHPDLLYLGSS